MTASERPRRYLAGGFLAAGILPATLFLGAAGCRCNRAADEKPDADAPLLPAPPPSSRAHRGREVEELWQRAATEAPDDLASLANVEGGAGLVEGADDAHRRVAVLAAAYTGDWVAGPWLADVAESSDRDLAKLAGESFVEMTLAWRPTRVPEDALELRATCDRWKAIAGGKKNERAVRIAAVRGLRMLRDSRCVTDKDIPSDIDAH